MALERLVRSGKTEQRVALWARTILGAAAGKSNLALAAGLKASRPTIIEWRKRFKEGGVKALQEGRPRVEGFWAFVAGEGSRSGRKSTSSSTTCDALELS